MPQTKRDLVLSPADTAEIYKTVGIFNSDVFDRALADIALARGIDRYQLGRVIDWQDEYAINALFNAAFSKPQIEVLTSPANTIFVSGGVRGGKSYISACRMLITIVRDLSCGYLPEGALYWLVGNKYLNVEAEYLYLGNWLEKLGLVASQTTHFDPGEITLSVCPLNTCSQRLKTISPCRHKPVKIITKSAQDEKSLASVAPFGILGCEGSQLTDWAYNALLERQVENDAPLIISGTLDAGQSGWFWEAFDKYERAPEEYPDDMAVSIPTYSNKAIFPMGLKDPRMLKMKALLTPLRWKSRIEGRPAPLPDLVFGHDFKPKYHIAQTQLEVEPNKEVWITIDHGYTSAYAVLIIQIDQLDPNTPIVQVKEELFVNYTKGREVAKIIAARDWFPEAKAAGLIHGTGDPASKHHHATDSQVELWDQYAGVSIIPPEISNPLDQIERVREMMSVHPTYNRAQLEIDSSCLGLLSEFGYCKNPLTGAGGAYRYAIDDKNQVIKDSLIDANNHAIKALAYFLLRRMSNVHSPGFIMSRDEQQRQMNKRNRKRKRNRRGY